MNTILNNLIQSVRRSLSLHQRRTIFTRTVMTGHRVSAGSSISKRMFLAGSLCAGLACPAQAQPEELSYLNIGCYNTKHYATSQENNGMDIAMSGTLFDYNGIVGNNAVHLLSNLRPFATSMVYDDKDLDERVVGVHYPNPADIYIVSTAIDYMGVTGRPNGVQLIHHPTGVRKFVFAPASVGQDLWPLGSLMDYNNGYIYVCGYTTRQMGPGMHPDYNTPKEAFVLRWDIDKDCIDFLRTYDWPNNNPTGNDYDMAHRMRLLRSGELWVGGSCNGGSGPAMMNMVIDPFGNLWTDSPLETPLIVDGAMIATSFDIAENLGGAGYSYIFSNYFAPRSMATGMFPQPDNYSITTVDAGTFMPPPGGRNHAYLGTFRNAWGTNIVEGNQPNSVIMSGYQDAEQCGQTFTGNTYPFLAEHMLNTTATGDIMVATFQWSTMLTWAGNNGFNILGGGLSNLLHGPVTTVRDVAAGTNEIIFNGPVTDHWTGCGNMALGLKYIRTNSVLDPHCKTERCHPEYEHHVAWTGNNVNIGGFRFICEARHYGPDPLGEKWFDCKSDNYYKPAGPAAVAVAGTADATIAATVFPNPAQDVIRVQLSGDVDKNAAVKVMLSDITGKQISVLYQGTAGSVNTGLSLPNLPRGLYTVTVTYNEARLKSIPLVLN